MNGPGSPQLTQLLDRATAEERRHATSVAATVRVAAAALFLMLALLMWKVVRAGSWEFSLPPLAIYLVAALLMYRFRERPSLTRYDWLPPLLDVAVVYVVHSSALPMADSPRLVATFGLGPFALLIALAGLTLRPRFTFLVAALAAAAETLIMLQAGITVGPILAAALVLMLAATITQATTRRVQRLGLDLATAEVSRQLELARLAETDAARQSAEMSLIETQAQNERLARLQRDKDSLVQLIVHDLRSPVNAMSLSLEYIAQDLQSKHASHDMLEALDDARATAARLGGMIAQILDTAKLEEGRLILDRAPLTVTDLLEKARQQAAPVARSKGVEMRIETAPGLAFRGDPRLFPRLIENLVSNSLRHAPTGGRVLLRAAKVDGHYRLSVHNNGAPIEASDRERIFEKFQQGDLAAQRLSGWGLGLYFCRMVVEAHGGRITVEDVDGWPTSFVIRLPAEEVTLARREDAPASRPSIPA